MTTVIAPVIPSASSPTLSQGTASTPRRGPTSKPPLPRLAGTTDRAVLTFHRLSAIDCHGRIADRDVIRMLGWESGTRLDVSERGGLIVVTSAAHGSSRINGQGRLHLPVGVQRWCGLKARDRLLLSGNRSSNELVVFPPPKLDEMLSQYLVVTLGGENE